MSTLVSTQFACNYQCTDVVAPRPCIGGLKVSSTLAIRHSSSPSGSLLCETLLVDFLIESCLHLIECCIHLLIFFIARSGVCNAIVDSPLVAYRLRVNPLGFTVHSVAACVILWLLSCCASIREEISLGLRQVILYSHMEGLCYPSSWLFDCFVMVVLFEAHRYVLQLFLYSLFIIKYSLM